MTQGNWPWGGAYGTKNHNNHRWEKDGKARMASAVCRRQVEARVVTDPPGSAQLPGQNRSGDAAFWSKLDQGHQAAPCTAVLRRAEGDGNISWPDRQSRHGNADA